MMRGPQKLVGYIAAHLLSTVPPLIDVAAGQWGLTAAQLPKPTGYDEAEPFVGDPKLYPYVGAAVGSDRDLALVDRSDSGEEEYVARYTATVFACVHTPLAGPGVYETPAYKATMRYRDDLTTIVKAALLGTPSLGQDDCELLPDTMSTSYSDAHPFNAQKTLYQAGGFITATFRLFESLHRPAVGAADTIEIHPGMLELNL